jgi:hypothetical protein
MARLNLDTGELNNKSIILEGNSPLTDIHKEILKNYEVIYIGRDFNQSLDGLPSCIKAIRFNIYDNFENKWMLNSHTEYRNFAFQQPLTNLHYGLEYLEIYGNNIPKLCNLPTSLKYLFLNLRNEIKLDYLPESLEVLYLEFQLSLLVDQLNLPIGLKELYLTGGVIGDIHNLPDELQLLYLNGIYTSINLYFELPSKLHTFIFTDQEWNTTNKTNIKLLFKNKKIPKNLKKCILPLHYADIYSVLKKYAKEYITNDIEWKFIDTHPHTYRNLHSNYY